MDSHRRNPVCEKLLATRGMGDKSRVEVLDSLPSFGGWDSGVDPILVKSNNKFSTDWNEDKLFGEVAAL